MKDETEIKKVIDTIKDNLTQTISELDTAFYRGQHSALKWVISEEDEKDDSD